MVFFIYFFFEKKLNIRFKLAYPQKALPCVIPRVLSHYLLLLGWIMKKVMIDHVCEMTVILDACHLEFLKMLPGDQSQAK